MRFIYIFLSLSLIILVNCKNKEEPVKQPIETVNDEPSIQGPIPHCKT